MTTNSKNDDLYLSKIFDYTKPTEYNTFFGRYLVTLMNVDGHTGDIGILDTNQHPAIYYHITVTAKPKGDGSGELSVKVFAWRKSEEGLPVKMVIEGDPCNEATELGCILRGFCDWVSTVVQNGGECESFLITPHKENELIVAPIVNLVSGAALGWALKTSIKITDQTDFYFPMFAVNKTDKFFSYSKGIPGETIVDFSDINEFINSEYYLTGDDIPPYVRLQQKECLLEVERQLIGTIN